MAKKIPFAQSKHKTDVVAYLTLVGWLIAYFCGNRAASRFHLNQALSILLADLGLNAVFMMATFADTAVASVLVRGMCGLLSFCVVVLWVIGLVRAAKGNDTPVPILGEVKLLK